MQSGALKSQLIILEENLTNETIDIYESYASYKQGNWSLHDCTKRSVDKSINTVLDEVK